MIIAMIIEGIMIPIDPIMIPKDSIFTGMIKKKKIKSN